MKSFLKFKAFLKQLKKDWASIAFTWGIITICLGYLYAYGGGKVVIIGTVKETIKADVKPSLDSLSTSVNDNTIMITSVRIQQEETDQKIDKQSKKIDDNNKKTIERFDFVLEAIQNMDKEAFRKTIRNRKDRGLDE